MREEGARGRIGAKAFSDFRLAHRLEGDATHGLEAHVTDKAIALGLDLCAVVHGRIHLQ